MVVDQAGTDQTISPPSEFEILNPRQNFDSVPDLAFDIYDVVNMKPTDLDLDATRAIVLNGDLDDVNGFVGEQSYQHDGENAPLALPPSNCEDQALVLLVM